MLKLHSYDTTYLSANTIKGEDSEHLCRYGIGTMLKGGNIEIMHSIQQPECIEKCRKLPSCVAGAYRAESMTCYLKDDSHEPLSYLNFAVKKRMSTFEFATECKDEDEVKVEKEDEVKNKPCMMIYAMLQGGAVGIVEGDSASQCLIKCRENPDCTAVSYITKKLTCLLKNNSHDEPVMSAWARENAVVSWEFIRNCSVVRTETPDIVNRNQVKLNVPCTYNGALIEGSDIEVVTAANFRECYEMCSMTSLCFAGSFESVTESCFLKDHTHTPPVFSDYAKANKIQSFDFAGACRRRNVSTFGEKTVPCHYPNTSISGGVIISIDANVASECVKECMKSDDCFALTFHGVSKRCFLKGKEHGLPKASVWAEENRMESYIFGVSCGESVDHVIVKNLTNPCKYQFAKYAGGDFRSESIETLEECQELCIAIEECYAFTYATKTCFLKSNLHSKPIYNDWTTVNEAVTFNYDAKCHKEESGKGGATTNKEPPCEYSSTIMAGGNTITKVVPDYDKCLDFCYLNLDQCKAVTFVGVSSRCILKDLSHSSPTFNIWAEASRVISTDMIGPCQTITRNENVNPMDVNKLLSPCKHEGAIAYGGNIDAVTAPTDAACLAYCREHSECAAMTYFRKTKQCVLKSKNHDIPKQTEYARKNSVVSYTYTEGCVDSLLHKKRCRFDHTTIIKGTIDSSTIPTEHQCIRKCENNPDCLGVTYKHDILECALKSEDHSPLLSNKWTQKHTSILFLQSCDEPAMDKASTHASCETANTEIEGETIKMKIVESKYHCHAICVGTSGCMAFTFDNKLGQCKLKSQDHDVPAKTTLAIKNHITSFVFNERCTGFREKSGHLGGRLCVRKDSYLIGGTIRFMITDSAVKCVVLCREEVNCTAVTYMGTIKKCILKTGAYDVSDSSSWGSDNEIVSYILSEDCEGSMETAGKKCVYHDAVIIGNTLSKRTTETQLQCEKFCKLTEDCIAISYVKSIKTCTLKKKGFKQPRETNWAMENDVVSVTLNRECKSIPEAIQKAGLKACIYEDAVITGATLDAINVNNRTNCIGICYQRKECAAINYFGPRKKCVLKSNAHPPMEENEFALSNNIDVVIFQKDCKTEDRTVPVRNTARSCFIADARMKGNFDRNFYFKDLEACDNLCREETKCIAYVSVIAKIERCRLYFTYSRISSFTGDKKNDVVLFGGYCDKAAAEGHSIQDMSTDEQRDNVIENRRKAVIEEENRKEKKGKVTEEDNSKSVEYKSKTDEQEEPVRSTSRSCFIANARMKGDFDRNFYFKDLEACDNLCREETKCIAYVSVIAKIERCRLYFTYSRISSFTGDKKNDVVLFGGYCDKAAAEGHSIQDMSTDEQRDNVIENRRKAVIEEENRKEKKGKVTEEDNSKSVEYKSKTDEQEEPVRSTSRSCFIANARMKGDFDRNFYFKGFEACNNLCRKETKCIAYVSVLAKVNRCRLYFTYSPIYSFTGDKKNDVVLFGGYCDKAAAEGHSIQDMSTDEQRDNVIENRRDVVIEEKNQKEKKSKATEKEKNKVTEEDKNKSVEYKSKTDEQEEPVRSTSRSCFIANARMKGDFDRNFYFKDLETCDNLCREETKCIAYVSVIAKIERCRLYFTYSRISSFTGDKKNDVVLFGGYCDKAAAEGHSIQDMSTDEQRDNVIENRRKAVIEEENQKEKKGKVTEEDYSKSVEYKSKTDEQEEPVRSTSRSCFIANARMKGDFDRNFYFKGFEACDNLCRKEMKCIAYVSVLAKVNRCRLYFTYSPIYSFTGDKKNDIVLFGGYCDKAAAEGHSIQDMSTDEQRDNVIENRRDVVIEEENQKEKKSKATEKEKNKVTEEDKNKSVEYKSKTDEQEEPVRSTSRSCFIANARMKGDFDRNFYFKDLETCDNLCREETKCIAYVSVIAKVERCRLYFTYSRISSFTGDKKNDVVLFGGYCDKAAAEGYSIQDMSTDEQRDNVIENRRKAVIEEENQKEKKGKVTEEDNSKSVEYKSKTDEQEEPVRSPSRSCFIANARMKGDFDRNFYFKDLDACDNLCREETKCIAYVSVLAKVERCRLYFTYSPIYSFTGDKKNDVVLFGGYCDKAAAEGHSIQDMSTDEQRDNVIENRRKAVIEEENQKEKKGKVTEEDNSKSVEYKSKTDEQEEPVRSPSRSCFIANARMKGDFDRNFYFKGFEACDNLCRKEMKCIAYVSVLAKVNRCRLYFTYSPIYSFTGDKKNDIVLFGGYCDKAAAEGHSIQDMSTDELAGKLLLKKKTRKKRKVKSLKKIIANLWSTNLKLPKKKSPNVAPLDHVSLLTLE